MGHAEVGVLLATCGWGALQLLVPVGLFVWGRRVARRHGNTRAWRIANWLPLVALGVLPLAMLTTIAVLVRTFAEIGNHDAATRATALARGISEGMNATAFGLLAACVLYVVAIITFVYGTFARPPS